MAILYKIDIDTICDAFDVSVEKEYDNEDLIGKDVMYNTISRSQRAAMLYKFMCSVGFNETVIDKTVLAEFIEAVTGGNIDVKGKDTYAYSNLNTKLKPEAIAKLKKIELKSKI